MSTKPSKAVLITGCSSGIGRATAERLASGGHTVYASARRLGSIADLERCGCKTLRLDVCEEASMREAVAVVERNEGAVGVLVNNAGYGQQGAFEDVPMEQVRRQFETNVFGPIRMTRLVLPAMRHQRWGKIVNLSSMGGRVVFPGGAYYHATKYAVEAMSDSLRFEVAAFGIDVIVIEPGAIRTRFADTVGANLPRSSAADSPYAEFNEAIGALVKSAYEGPLAVMAAEPDAVARVIERAITTRRPRTRYPVTVGARVLMGLRRWLPDRAFDAIAAASIPRPSP